MHKTVVKMAQAALILLGYDDEGEIIGQLIANGDWDSISQKALRAFTGNIGLETATPGVLDDEAIRALSEELENIRDPFDIEKDEDGPDDDELESEDDDEDKDEDASDKEGLVDSADAFETQLAVPVGPPTDVEQPTTGDEQAKTELTDVGVIEDLPPLTIKPIDGA